MENITPKNIIEIITKGGISAALLAIVLYFGSSFLNSIQQMQKDLANIRLEITKIQAAVLTPEQVEKMIDTKIKLLEYKFHGKECDTFKMEAR